MTAAINATLKRNAAWVAGKSQDEGQLNQGLPLTLVGQDQFYAGPGQSPTFDLPAARPPKTSPVSAKWHTSTSVNFIGLDTFYGEQGQSPTRDLPPARPPKVSPHIRTWINTSERLI